MTKDKKELWRLIMENMDCDECWMCRRSETEIKEIIEDLGIKVDVDDIYGKDVTPLPFICPICVELIGLYSFWHNEQILKDLWRKDVIQGIKNYNTDLFDRFNDAIERMGE